MDHMMLIDKGEATSTLMPEAKKEKKLLICLLVVDSFNWMHCFPILYFSDYDQLHQQKPIIETLLPLTY